VRNKRTCAGAGACDRITAANARFSCFASSFGSTANVMTCQPTTTPATVSPNAHVARRRQPGCAASHDSAAHPNAIAAPGNAGSR